MSGNADDVAQLRRTVRALELLAESYAAHQRGDQASMNEIFEASGRECPLEWNLLHSGMLIGEIPQPAHPGWDGYLWAQRAKLAQMEEEDAE
jgi:hypothetical protein